MKINYEKIDIAVKSVINDIIREDWDIEIIPQSELVWNSSLPTLVRNVRVGLGFDIFGATRAIWNGYYWIQNEQYSTACSWVEKEFWKYPCVYEMDWPLELAAAVLSTARKLLPAMVKEHNDKIIASRKEYGRNINTILKKGNLSREAINAYWRMEWRNECSPEEFIERVKDDSVGWRFAASAKSWRVLERVNADELRSSVTRCKDLAKAVCKARKERPASNREVRELLRTCRTTTNSLSVTIKAV